MAFCRVRILLACMVAFTVVAMWHAHAAPSEEVPAPLRTSVDRAVDKVKPALVRIEVVSTRYSEGRELKRESSGSGVIVTPEGHVITNHHVAGRATRLLCTLSTKEEVEAELIGRDPLTDVAVIKLHGEEGRAFPTAGFGDSSSVEVGQQVLAMGSPMSLSQSVTLGIVSNTELVLPQWMSQWGGITQEGERVGALVRWIGHDAAIYPGNSGGPLVNLDGEIIGINEISIGLGGAIPGNLAKAVADELIATGEVSRSWLGLEVQPRLKHGATDRGVLVSGTLEDSPAADAGFKPGDILVRLDEAEVDVRFLEQLPALNQMTSKLPLNTEIKAVVLRDEQETTLTVKPTARERVLPRQHEFREWGVTARNLSFVLARQMKRDNEDGVLITSIRPGGPADDAKPRILDDDVLVSVNGESVKNAEALRRVTAEVVTGQTDPVPVLVGFERKTEQYVTVVKVGIKELEDPGLEVKKAWLPVQSQVLTRDIAEQLGRPELSGFRVTQVFSGSAAEAAGLRVGDYILAVDGEPLEASAPEDYEELEAVIRQYRVGSMVSLTVLRGDQESEINVELARAPKLSREMAKYRDNNCEFTARNVAFFDKAKEKWSEQQRGVLVERIEPGGWAALGFLNPGDLILEVNGTPVEDVKALKSLMKDIAEAQSEVIILRVLRGIHTRFLELEPKWGETPSNGSE